MHPDDAPDPLLGTTGLLDYADDLEKELLMFDAPPIIMGHSMGGLLAQILASRGLAEAAVLLTPAPPAGIMSMKPSAVKCFSDALMTWGFWKRPFRFSFDRTDYACMSLLPEEIKKEVYSRMVFESGRAAFEAGLWFLDRRGASKVNSDEVKCPILVLSGAKDRMIPSSVVKKVADKYHAVSTFKKFEGHAHWIIGEPGWEDIAEYVNRWLEKDHK
jgi:pimeloyl-ACP methyl ester carboxylesterase